MQGIERHPATNRIAAESEQIFSSRCQIEQAAARSRTAANLFPANDLSTPTDVGGAGRDRTDDPLLAKQVLSQLSYGP
jgi:hypothetical protein